MRHSRWLIVCGLVMIAFLALAPVVGAQGFGFGNLFGGFFGFEEEEEEEESKVAPDGIPIGFSLVAENRNLELFLDAEQAQLLVRDKETQAIWRTNPDLDNMQMSVGQLWEKLMRSQVLIQYTDDKKRNKKTTNNIDQQAIVTYEPIPRGVRAIFHMQALGFQIPVEYRLGENYLEARIPDDLLLETSTYALVTIELVPFFGAATDDDVGYMVIPDSSGAVTYFKKDHPRYARQFQEFAYGPDEVRFYGMRDYFIAYNQARRQVFGPYFGLVNGDQAFLGLVTEGDFDVKINAAPSGYIVDLYRAGAEFEIRKEYSALLSRTRRVQTMEGQRIATDRAVRWYLLTGEDANYVGMANTYRDYLREKYNIVGRLGLKDDVAPLHVRITQAVTKPGLILDELITVTTFEQAREIVERLQEIGISNMDVTLVGWTERGVDGIVPRHWPPERALGGAKGLQEFAQWAKERGVDVFLEDNYLDANQSNGGFSARNDVVRTAAKTPVHSGRRFLISPIVAYNKFARESIPRLAELGVAGLDLKHVGEMLIYDRNDTARAERADTAAAWLNIAALARKLMGRVAVQGGNAFFLAVADKVTNAPIDESTHVFVDHSIPFYQIVIHGLVPVYGYPSNLRNDPRKEFLRMVEYGMLPIFELTYEDSALLRDTEYAMLFSSQFDTWLETVKEEFEAINVGMGMLQRVAIVSHGQIAPNVFETGYEDGTRVIVNYNDYPYEEDSVTVPALDYVILKGEHSL